jgi:hypothetical protein
MSNLHNRAGMNTATAGQGTMTLNSAIGAVAINVAGFQSFATSGVVDQEIVQYLILDVNGNWEVGTGTYSVSGPTLTRTVKYSNNSNTAISLSGSAQVFICALASDGFDVLGGSTNPMRGFDTPVNLQINATSNGTLLTVAIKGNNGADPSPTNPVYIPFRDSTATGGDPIWRIVTSALSINTNAAGATLGTSNNTAFRFWLCAFDNAGTVVLALINCSSATTIFPLNEGLVATTTGFTASSNLAGVFYTPNGTALTSKSFRVLGFIEYNSTGLATAGTYASTPNFIQIFGPGIKKPGDEIQKLYATTASSDSFTTTAYVAATNARASIAPQSAANLILVQASGEMDSASAAVVFDVQLSRGTTNNTNIIGSNSTTVGLSSLNAASISCVALDKPNVIASQTYSLQGKMSATGTGNITSGSRTTVFILTEIMG